MFVPDQTLFPELTDRIEPELSMFLPHLLNSLLQLRYLRFVGFVFWHKIPPIYPTQRGCKSIPLGCLLIQPGEISIRATFPNCQPVVLRSASPLGLDLLPQYAYFTLDLGKAGRRSGLVLSP